MRRAASAVASAFAASVFPTPASPSSNTGFSSTSPRKSAVARPRSGRVGAAQRRVELVDRPERHHRSVVDAPRPRPRPPSRPEPGARLVVSTTFPLWTYVPRPRIPPRRAPRGAAASRPGSARRDSRLEAGRSRGPRRSTVPVAERWFAFERVGDRTARGAWTQGAIRPLGCRRARAERHRHRRVRSRDARSRSTACSASTSRRTAKGTSRRRCRAARASCSTRRRS